MNTSVEPRLSTIEPQQLHHQARSGHHVTVIDVRTPAEFREVHFPSAHNVPLDRLDPAALRDFLPEPSAPVYVICRSGNRAAKACEQLAAAGLNAINVSGGIQAWEQAGLPVLRGKKTISLERQVRIAAGTLVLVGIALGALVHPSLYGLAAFVGAGLVFAGITDTCGMGLLLARMPWNQLREPRSKPSAEACDGKTGAPSQTSS